MSSPIAHEGSVYGFSQFRSGQFFCLDPVSGEVKWRGEARMGEHAQLLSLPGCILTLTDDGSCPHSSSLSGSSELMQRYQVSNGQTWTAPALVHDRLLIKELKHLTSWGLPAQVVSAEETENYCWDYC